MGQQAGCEAAVHAMSSLYDSQTTEAILLVDANNAFNSLNREVALRNIQHLCPSLSVVLINTYREDIELFVDGATLLSTEGTTQGDPLAMAMYGIGILPLIKKLQTCDVTQTWYADRNMLALPTRLGGLGIINPSLMSLYHYTTSVNVTSALANLVITRATLMPSDFGIQQLEEKNLARNQRKAMETASVTELLAITETICRDCK